MEEKEEEEERGKEEEESLFISCVPIRRSIL